MRGLAVLAEFPAAAAVVAAAVVHVVVAVARFAPPSSPARLARAPASRTGSSVLVLRRGRGLTHLAQLCQTAQPPQIPAKKLLAEGICRPAHIFRRILSEQRAARSPCPSSARRSHTSGPPLCASDPPRSPLGLPTKAPPRSARCCRILLCWSSSGPSTPEAPRPCLPSTPRPRTRRPGSGSLSLPARSPCPPEAPRSRTEVSGLRASELPA
mmetsp:Transcript_44711/g.96435  ORF Transcript_44711/g.96435 Transcript_44711/m.96435 type:complete len:212 (-) Transcript_44711:250-885(-)